MLNYTNNLEKAERILARVICANGLQSRDKVHQEPTVRSVKLAWQLMDMVAATEVTQYINTKLVSLSYIKEQLMGDSRLVKKRTDSDSWSV